MTISLANNGIRVREDVPPPVLDDSSSSWCLILKMINFLLGELLSGVWVQSAMDLLLICLMGVGRGHSPNYWEQLRIGSRDNVCVVTRSAHLNVKVIVILSVDIEVRAKALTEQMCMFGRRPQPEYLIRLWMARLVWFHQRFEWIGAVSPCGAPLSKLVQEMQMYDWSLKHVHKWSTLCER